MSNNVIDWFRDQGLERHGFLSNFYRMPSGLVYKGIVYPTSEHAYQAQKTVDYDTKLAMAAITSPQAVKAYGNSDDIKIRADWESIKIPIMYAVLRVKFKKDPLRRMLLDTGDAILIEGNRWHDNTWGQCFCKVCVQEVGHNLLGKLLTLVREEHKIKEERQNV